MKVWHFTLVTLLAVFVGAAIPADAQQPHNALIGDWQGEYFVRSQGYSNKVYLTVKSVDADGKVIGTIYLQGPAPYHNKDMRLFSLPSG
jgi:predicted AlkP superfamily pyrophosphatase or phosphodiesterase